MIRSNCMFLLCATAMLVARVSIAEDKPNAEKDNPILSVNPVGEPKALRKGDAVRYFVWYDATGWHLQTDTAGKAHVFNGSIEVVGGKITSITDFENLEAAKNKKKADLGVVNKAKDQITFKFTTSKKRDGFDFQVDESAKEIRFKLLIDGKSEPQRVLIGPASQPSPDAVLVLPAHPR